MVEHLEGVGHGKVAAYNFIAFLQLINEKKRDKKGVKYKDSGHLIFTSVSTYREYSFVEYIAGG